MHVHGFRLGCLVSYVILQALWMLKLASAAQPFELTVVQARLPAAPVPRRR